MSASKICEPHAFNGEVHGAFAAVTSPGYGNADQPTSVCKDYLNAWLDHADDGVLSEPTGLEFIVPGRPVIYDDEPPMCRCNTTPLPPCGPCENGEIDPDAC